MNEEKQHSVAFREILRKISSQSRVIFLGKLLSYVLTFGSSIILARLLGPASLGQFTLGFLLVQIAGNIGKLGFESSMIRFIPIQDIDINKKMIKDCSLLSLAASLTIGIGIYLFANSISIALYHTAEMTGVLKTFIILLPIFSLYGVLSASIRGLNRADVEFIITSVVTPLFFIMGLVPVFLIGERIAGAIWARTLSYFIPLVFMLMILRRAYPELISSKTNKYDFKKLVKFTLPMLTIGLMYFLLGQIDIIMLGFFLDVETVGIYSVAVRISIMIAVSLEVVTRTFEPEISRLSQMKSVETLGNLLKVLTKWIFYLSLFLTALVYIFRVEVLRLFGESFTMGSTALVILSAGQLFNALTGPTGKILVMSGKQNWEVMNSVCIILLNVVLNVILIPRFGINGAALGTAISLSTINIMKVLEVFKEFRIHPYSMSYYKGMLSISIGTICAYVSQQFLVVLKVHFILNMIIGSSILLLITTIMMYKLNFESEDRLIFNKIKIIN